MLANATAQNKADFAGYIIRGKATNPVVADFLPILWSFGGDVFDDNWNVVFDNAQSQAAIEFLVDKLKPVAQADPGQHRCGRPRPPHGDRPGLPVIGLARRDQYRRARSRLVEGHRQGHLHPDPEGPQRQGRRHDGQLDARHPKASKNQQPAADFIKWMLQADTQMTYAQNNGIPSRTSVLKDPSLAAANPYFPVLARPCRHRRTGGRGPTSGMPSRRSSAPSSTRRSPASRRPRTSSPRHRAEIRTLMKGAGYPTQ